jgi:hypothetical protein
VQKVQKKSLISCKIGDHNIIPHKTPELTLSQSLSIQQGKTNLHLFAKISSSFPGME